MAKHIWEWDKRSSNPMIVVCVRCQQKKPLSEVVDELGCDGCPAQGVQEGLFDREDDTDGTKR